MYIVSLQTENNYYVTSLTTTPHPKISLYLLNQFPLILLGVIGHANLGMKETSYN